MGFAALPASAAWRHVTAAEGFESAFFTTVPGGHRVAGGSAGIEEGEAWCVRYAIEVDQGWRTRTAHVWGVSALGEYEVRLECDGDGQWWVDGEASPQLEGCFDVDLEPSACTNAFPVHRLRLRVGESAAAPAAYVRALDLRVERLEQAYTRVDDGDGHQRYDYRSPAFGFASVLTYDGSGLALDYPGIATRAL
jgi:uncharacterized protein